MKQLWKSKTKAFLIHFSISLAIALILAFIVFSIWYPLPLPKATGVIQPFLLLVSIDIILGPMLTFFVYKVGKKNLKIDLLIIVLLQLCALSYGMYYVMQGRPAWLVQVNDRIRMVSPSIALDRNNESISNDLLAQPWGKPQFKSVEFSSDMKTRNKQLDDDVKEEGIVYQPSQYQAYNPRLALENAKSIDELYKFNESFFVNKVLQQYDVAFKWLPLRGSDTAQDMVVLLDNQGNILDIVDLRPWKTID